MPDSPTRQSRASVPGLRISLGQVTDKGTKPVNQDFHGAVVPAPHLVASKGIALALADGISSSDVSQIASEVAVTSFLQDYFATPESWSVKSAGQRVIQAANSWLFSQTRQSEGRYNLDKGYVCTFTALVLKGRSAHFFHIGDARLLRLSGNALEPLTQEHRLWSSPEKSYLSKALGIHASLDMDYGQCELDLHDCFILMTDGVYEFVSTTLIREHIREHADNLDLAAQAVINAALEAGSDDNLSIQIVRIDALPEHGVSDLNQQLAQLPFAPELRSRMPFDGYTVQRELHASSRSHVFLATDDASGDKVVLKLPSVDLRGDPDYLERFLIEEWVARRVDNPHLLKPAHPDRTPTALYTTFEYIEGQSLHQWMLDNPTPELETVRRIVEQIARGLQALHRQEMLHQDLRPHNVMIDASGNVKIIDFGSVRIAGVAELARDTASQPILGTAQYSAPEYFIGDYADERADLYSLAAITYQMLSGRLPYGPDIARATTRAAQKRLRYQSVLDPERSIPLWVDDVLRKALQPNPDKRQRVLSEFIQDLRKPDPALLQRHRPLLESRPLLFWKGLSLGLFIIILLLLAYR
ncbi:protein kinase domain-containing protein [Pokkaliibacter sp. CJK22405]|uniref:protein kinase domain-containing protein n=1 Tax=Pokkaliibacter sp. CJK22405 TaxID=3384615 RepID=UPI0039856868